MVFAFSWRIIPKAIKIKTLWKSWNYQFLHFHGGLSLRPSKSKPFGNHGIISSRFLHVLRNYNLLIGWQRNLSFLTTAYRYLPVVLPYLVLFPQYFSGTIQFGDMTQANFAFTQVYGALSLIVSQIEQITNFAAGVDRLAAFTETMTADAEAPER